MISKNSSNWDLISLAWEISNNSTDHGFSGVDPWKQIGPVWPSAGWAVPLRSEPQRQWPYLSWKIWNFWRYAFWTCVLLVLSQGLTEKYLNLHCFLLVWTQWSRRLFKIWWTSQGERYNDDVSRTHLMTYYHQLLSLGPNAPRHHIPSKHFQALLPLDHPVSTEAIDIGNPSDKSSTFQCGVAVILFH